MAYEIISGEKYNGIDKARQQRIYQYEIASIQLNKGEQGRDLKPNRAFTKKQNMEVTRQI